MLLQKLRFHSSQKSPNGKQFPSLTSLKHTRLSAMIEAGSVQIGRENNRNSRFKDMSFQKCVLSRNRYLFVPAEGAGSPGPSFCDQLLKNTPMLTRPYRHHQSKTECNLEVTILTACIFKCRLPLIDREEGLDDAVCFQRAVCDVVDHIRIAVWG